jgi:hypothetical protein
MSPQVLPKLFKMRRHPTKKDKSRQSSSILDLPGMIYVMYHLQQIADLAL